MSSNSGTGFQGIDIGGAFNSFAKAVKNSNPTSFIMNSGNSDVPYAFMGIVTAVMGAFAYVTYKDYADEVASNISETLDTVQSSELFIPSKENDEAPSLFETGNVEEESEQENTSLFDMFQQDKKEEKDSQDIEPKEEETKEESKEEELQIENNIQPDEEDKPEEPGEKYKLGGTKHKRKRKRKTAKKRKK